MSQQEIDPIAELRKSGVDIDRTSEAQRQVIASLTAAEVAVLTSVAQRMEGDVEAHQDTVADWGIVLW